MTRALSREIPIEPARTALLFVDVPKYNCTWPYGTLAWAAASWMVIKVFDAGIRGRCA